MGFSTFRYSCASYLIFIDFYPNPSVKFNAADICCADIVCQACFYNWELQTEGCDAYLVICFFFFFLRSVHLYYLFPSLEEGGLATYRTAIVQNQHLAMLAKVCQTSDPFVEKSNVFFFGPCIILHLNK